VLRPEVLRGLPPLRLPAPDALGRGAIGAGREIVAGLAVAARGIARAAIHASGATRTFLAATGLYLATAWILVFILGTVALDAWSRVANASYVLFSRDPHLGAIGFVWNPLPSLLVLPILPFKTLWPALLEQGFAANIVSAVAMGLAVVQVRGFLVDGNVVRPVRLALTALFAIHPLVLQYGANGMSEALYLLFLVAAARYLVRWARHRELGALVVAGVALGAAYLTRYEALAAGVGAVATVGLISAGTGPGRLRDRLAVAAADALVLGTPIAAMFLAWAGASLLIVGSPFETFTSAYGNAAQLRAQGGVEAGAQGVGYLLRQAAGIAPGLAVALPLAALVAWRRRDPAILAIGGILGGTMAFSGLVFVAGSSFGWLRFLIAAIPLVTLLAGLLVSRARPVGGRTLSTLRSQAHEGSEPRSRSATYRRGGARLASLAATATLGLVAIVSAAVGVPRSADTMLDRQLSRGDEAAQLQAVVASTIRGGPPPALGWHVGGAEIANTIDSLAFPRGSVLLDSFDGFPIIVNSSRPDQFVITSDRDFLATLADPAAFGVRYILVPRPVGNTQLDAVGQRFPDAYRDGDGVGRLIRDFTRPEYSWRLYEVGAVSPVAPAG
jgi:hypothetical protein